MAHSWFRWRTAGSRSTNAPPVPFIERILPISVIRCFAPWWHDPVIGDLQIVQRSASLVVLPKPLDRRAYRRVLRSIIPQLKHAISSISGETQNVVVQVANLLLYSAPRFISFLSEIKALLRAN